jgi:hypothetical protein
VATSGRCELLGEFGSGNVDHDGRADGYGDI